MEEGDRAFKNSFPDYSGDALLGDDGKLAPPYQEKLISAVQRLLEKFERNAGEDSTGKDYSVYTGISGLALLHLHLQCKYPGARGDYHLKKARTMVDYCMPHLRGQRMSFLCGDAGPVSLAAVILNKMKNKQRCDESVSRVEAMCDQVCKDKSIPDEILYGRCGYLSALLFLQHNLGKDCIKSETVLKVVEAVLRSGEALSWKTKSEIPLMYEWHEKAYLGAAHGLAGIYYMLLRVDDPSIQERVQQLVRPCIDYMLTLRFASGNCPSSLNSSSGDMLVHWCHGAPGWVHMFAQAYKVYKDKRYLEAAKDCGNVVWKRGLLCKGYGLCHGTAGNAYTFLTLYKLTSEQKYLYYAFKFAEWCCDYGKHCCRIADRPYSLFEGMAGTIYFLVDMLDPAHSSFPTFEF